MKIRRYKPTLVITTLAAGVVGGANAVHAQIPCGYDVQIIQGPFCAPFGFPPTRGKGISETGEIVGFYSACVIGPSRAFRWTEETGLVTLEIPGGFTESGAEDIDSATGWIVGAMIPQGQEVPTAALWIDGRAIDLGTLPGGNYSHAFAINNGRIVGKWGNNIIGDPGIGAFLYQNGKMLNIHADFGTPNSWAWDVNAAGQVTGWMGDALLQDGQPYIWASGKVVPLPNPPEMFSGRAHGITSNGSRVVGAAQFDDGTTFGLTRAVLWDNGRPVNLGTLPDEDQSSAADVRVLDDVIQVVGASGGAGFVWQDGVMYDLNDLIAPEEDVEITGCRAINSKGQIAATGHDAAGDVVALLLTPVQRPVGDLDQDCSVGASDLLILLSQWGRCGDCDDCPTDLNRDCNVGAIDLLILLVNWG